MSSFFEFGDESVNVGYDGTGLTNRRFLHGNDFDFRSRVHSEIFGADFFHGLLFGFHDVGQSGVARLVESQIHAEHCWGLHFHDLQTAVDLTSNGQNLGFVLDLKVINQLFIFQIFKKVLLVSSIASHLLKKIKGLCNIIYLAAKGATGPVQDPRDHLRGLIGIVIYSLFPNNHQVSFFV